MLYSVWQLEFFKQSTTLLFGTIKVMLSAKLSVFYVSNTWLKYHYELPL